MGKIWDRAYYCPCSFTKRRVVGGDDLSKCHIKHLLSISVLNPRECPPQLATNGLIREYNFHM